MDLLHAGRYAIYVYTAYGLSALVLIGMTAQTLLAARTARRQAEGGKVGARGGGAKGGARGAGQ